MLLYLYKKGNCFTTVQRVDLPRHCCGQLGVLYIYLQALFPVVKRIWRDRRQTRQEANPSSGRQLSFHKTKNNFSTLWQAFSPGDVQKRPLLPQSAIGQFSRTLVGLADFAGSKFQRMANWPSFDKKIETGRLFRIILPVSIFLNRNWPVGHPLEFKPAKSVGN